VNPNGSSEDWPDPRRLTTEDQIMLLAWLLAEQQYRTQRLAQAVAAQIAAQMQPQLRDGVLQQLLG
jgi:hypothetical protein